MTVHHLSLQNSILSEFISELRDVEIQKDKMRFRKNLERVGELMAYEISKTLRYENTETVTPLGVAETRRLNEELVVACILRAGLPLHQGVLNIFDKAENAFISAYRKHHKNNSFEIALEYVACPDLSGKTLLLCDPMLASGSSLSLACSALKSKGTPSHTHLLCAIASTEGIEFLKKNFHGQDYTLWCAAIDEELTAQAYIVPGLGDAGDLAFGEKL